MNVLVDTCVWSYALRHKNPDPEIEKKLAEIIKEGRAVIIGPVRQEILSGISKDVQFKTLKEYLSFFKDIPLTKGHFVKAAEFSNICMKKGIQGSSTDFLICAVAFLENLEIFTTDVDFWHFSKYLTVRLFEK
jgi:hypothetical protein